MKRTKENVSKVNFYQAITAVGALFAILIYALSGNQFPEFYSLGNFSLIVLFTIAELFLTYSSANNLPKDYGWGLIHLIVSTAYFWFVLYELPKNPLPTVPTTVFISTILALFGWLTYESSREIESKKRLFIRGAIFLVYSILLFAI